MHDVKFSQWCLYIFTLNGILLYWLGGRKSIRPVKNWGVGRCCGYLNGARCRLEYGTADATVSCFGKIHTGFTFLVPAHPGSPRQRVVKRVRVCVCTIISFELPSVRYNMIQNSMILDAILTCAQKLTWVSLSYSTQKLALVSLI